MKYISQFITCIAIILFTLACTKEEELNIPLTGDYLPMQAGNYWEIEHSIRITITGSKVIDNKTYSEFVQANDTLYYRIENGKIYARHLTEPETVKFDLSANVNDIWVYNSGAEWNVKMISKTDTLLINHTKVANCYKFFFDIPMGADDEHYIWLAPGIGFIRMDCGFCPYPFLNLEKAKVNNELITFP